MRQVYRYFLQAGPWTVLLWGVSGWLSGQALIGFTSPMPLVAPAPLAPEQDRRITPIGQLLGDSSISKSQFSSSDIKIQGILAQGQKGAILISVRNGPTKTLAAGSRDPEGWMLESVDQGTIRISHYGSIFELPTPRASRGLQTNSSN